MVYKSQIYYVFRNLIYTFNKERPLLINVQDDLKYVYDKNIYIH